MADITNPEALKFVAEEIRPLAEKFRALKVYVDAALVKWWGGGISALVPNDSSPVADGREAEGVSRLTGVDINNLVTQLAAYQTALNAAGVADVVSKPCVRSITVE